MRLRVLVPLFFVGLLSGGVMSDTASSQCPPLPAELCGAVTTVTGSLPGTTSTLPIGTTTGATTTTTTSPTTTQTQPTQTQTQPSDTRPPVFTIRPVPGQRLSVALVKGLQATATCDEACGFVVYALLGEGSSAKVLGVAYGTAGPGTPAAVPIALTAEGKAALAVLKKARVNYVGAGSDAAKNVSSLYTSVGALKADPKPKKPKKHKKHRPKKHR